MAEDAGFGVVVITPDFGFVVPFQFFAQSGAGGVGRGSVRVAVANADQAVGDVAGRLDFDVLVAYRIATLVVAVAPDQIFGSTFFAGVVVNAAGARIPAFAGCPVFECAVLRTPPNEVGAEFALVFRFVAGGAGFPDAFVAITMV